MSSTAMEWTYEDVLDDILLHCRRFWWRFGGEWLDWLSEGNYIFVQAYHSHDEDKGPFIDYLRFMLSRRLYEKVRGKVKRYKGIERGHPRERFYANVPDITYQVGFLDRLRMELSDDAYNIVQLVLTVPNDLKLIMLTRPEQEGHGVRNIRGSVKELLCDIGWSVDKITETFAEIKEALC
jgi:hypothetical protein